MTVSPCTCSQLGSAARRGSCRTRGYLSEQGVVDSDVIHDGKAGACCWKMY